MGVSVGIDLGTTYSAIAFVDESGQPEIVPNREGERITPSVVLFDEDGPIVGSLAKTASVDDPDNTVQFVKRKIGEREAFRTSAGDSYSPEQVSALIIKRLKEDAEEMLGQTITDAVISVPAYFNDAQRKATADAGKIAGLTVKHVINEPTAAALAYGLGRQTAKERALVYDLGGGTFDVTILELSSSEIKVLTTEGEKHLGGFNWDNELMLLIADALFGEKADEMFEDAELQQVIRERAETAKRTLSSRDKARVRFRHGGNDYKVEITKQSFEEVTRGLVNQTRRIMELAMDNAGLEWTDLDKILLVGGSTRMPAIADMIKATTGHAPSKELHPDEVVAMGAAVRAAMASGRSLPSSMAVAVRDVCSHSLGVIALRNATSNEEFNSIILPKDSQVPGSASNTYRTVVDKQSKYRVQVTQGESEDPELVHVIGECTIDVPPYPIGAPMRVTFHYDENAIIHVNVFDETAGKDLGEFKIQRVANLPDLEIDRLAAEVDAITVN